MEHPLLEVLNKAFSFSTENEQEMFVAELGEASLLKRQQNSQTNPVHTIPGDILLYVMQFHHGFQTNISLSENHKTMIHIPKELSRVGELHNHAFLELVYILEGEIDFIIEGVHKRYRQGEWCLLNPNVRHAEEHHGDFTAVYLDLALPYAGKLLQHMENRVAEIYKQFITDSRVPQHGDYMDFLPIEAFPKKANDQLQETLLHLAKEMLEEPPGYQHMIDGLLERVLTYLQMPEYYHCSHTRMQVQNNHDLLQQLIFYLGEHPVKITRDELGEKFGYNGNYLNRFFQKHMGESLSAYHRHVCLNRAAELLLNSQMSASQIGTEIGFESRSAFYQQFARQYGVTPAEYRRGTHPEK